MGAWNSGATVYWNGIGKVFKFAFNDLYRIDGVSLSIDNNDTYALEYSTDDRIWSALFSVGANLGEIGWGMDTMSTVATDPEYIEGVLRKARIQSADVLVEGDMIVVLSE